MEQLVDPKHLPVSVRVGKTIAQLIRDVAYEPYRFYRLMEFNFFATVICGMSHHMSLVFGIYWFRGGDPADVFSTFLMSLAYFALYQITFDLGNQIAGHEGDRLDKPTRPIPSGLMSLTGAKIRLVAFCLLFAVYAYAVNALPSAIVWMGISLAYHFLGLDRHWFGKNSVFLWLGIGGMIYASVGMSHLDHLLGSVEFHVWALVSSFLAGTGTVVQDFRDVAGDRNEGRVTLPMQIGERPARLLLGVLYPVLGIPLVHFVVLRPGREFPGVWWFEAVYIGLLLSISYRLFRYSDPAKHKFTYAKLWVGIYILHGLTTGFLFGR